MTKTIDMMTKQELSDYQNEKEKELRQMMEARQIFASKEMQLKIEIKELKNKVSVLELQVMANKEQYDKSVTNCQILRSLLSETKNRYFNVQI